MKDIIIIGGGLAGLISALRLGRQGIPVIVIEKYTYPRHKVCGEYISMEVHDFLSRENMLPSVSYPYINKLLISSVKGSSSISELDPGGFGISRFFLENHLFQLGTQAGVNFVFDEVTSVNNDNVLLKSGAELRSDIIIAAYGKRSKLDRELNRNYITHRSPYAGVKFHAKLENHDPELIALHNFDGGYCGICNVEDGTTNICYLVERDKIKSAGSIDRLEEKVLFRNPFLKDAFEQADRKFEKPLVINEISFATKTPVEGKIAMIGDAAGMITPLCGNGMSIAIHSAKGISDLIIRDPQIKAVDLCVAYSKFWSKTFKNRLQWGRAVQKTLFGRPWASSMAVAIAKRMPQVTTGIISLTHGEKI